jgi:hypothetical protein
MNLVVNYNDEDEDFAGPVTLTVQDSASGDNFNAQIKHMSCCGLKEICYWTAKFSSQENANAILTKFLEILGLEQNGGYAIFAVVRHGMLRGDGVRAAGGYLYGFYEQMVTFFDHYEGVVKSPWQKNYNSGNYIQVYMLPAWGVNKG